MMSSVCLSVCHVRVCCQNELSHPRTILPSGSHTIVVFPHQIIGAAIFRRGPPTGGVECKGYKNRYFPPIFRFMLEMIKHRGIVAMEGE